MTQTITTFRPRPTGQSLEATAALLQVVGQACRAQSGLFRPPATISLEYLATADSIRCQLVSPTQRLAELLSHELRVWHPAAEVAVLEQDDLPYSQPYALAELRCTSAPERPIGPDRPQTEPLLSLLGALHRLRAGELALVQLLLQPVSPAAWLTRHRPLFAPRPASDRPEHGLRAALERRAQQPGFSASLRLLVLAPSERAARQQLGALLTSLAPLQGPWNGLRPAAPPLRPLPVRLAIHQRRFRRFGPRLSLSAREAALLYTVPEVPASAVPKLALARGLHLPPPFILPKQGLPLGRASTSQQPIFLTDESRLRHLLLLGPTGSGKTHALVSFVLADIQAGRGCSVLTPSPDAIRRIVRRIPPDQLDRVVVARFDDPAWVFGINPLAQDGVESWRTASELVAIWERLYPQFWGPLVSDIFKHGVMALTEQRGSSLLELVDLLEDPEQRRRLLAGSTLSDPMVRRYWERFDDLTLGRQETRTSSSLNKIRAPLIIPWLRRTLGTRNSLAIRQALDQRLVVLWDLSNLADEGRLLGSLIASQYFQAAINRADLPEERRVEHYLYADEWQSWPTTAWSKGLDLLRQFKVGLVLAGQRLDQVPEELRQATLANVGSALIWGLRSDADAVTMAKWLATPGLEAGDIKRLGRFQLYARVLFDGAPGPAFSLETLPLPDEVPDPDGQEQRLLEQSHQRYYRPAADVDQELARRFDHGHDDPQSRPRRRAPAQRTPS